MATLVDLYMYTHYLQVIGLSAPTRMGVDTIHKPLALRKCVYFAHECLPLVGASLHLEPLENVKLAERRSEDGRVRAARGG